MSEIELTEELLSRPEHLDQPELEEKPIDLMPKQDAFIFSEAEFAAYGGGVGNGKSMSGIIKVYNHCMEFPGAFFLVGRRHATDLRDSTLKDFLQLMRGYGKFSPGTNTYHFPNGSQVIFRHLDDLQSLTNMNLSGFYIDQAEEITEETFDYLVGRCRRQKGLTGGMITRRPKFITYNPNGHDWIWRLFIEKLDADGKRLTRPGDYFFVTATTYENRANLPEDYIKAIEQRPEEWKKRFIYGSHETKAGRIFDDFNRSIHVVPVERMFQIRLDWPRFRAIDHGQNNPTACLWGTTDYDDTIFVYQEYYKPNASVSQHVERIRSLSKLRAGQTMVDDEYTYTVIDPSTHAKTREKDGHLYSVADEYYDAGIMTMRAQNDVLAGINRVREYLKVDPERIHPWLKVHDLDEDHPLWKYNIGRDPDDPCLGSPRLFIFARCEMLVKELPEYQWQPLKYNQMGTQNSHEKPVKNFDHAVDALRYMIMSRPISPDYLQRMDPAIFNDPLALAKYARQMGTTKDDLVAQRFKHEGYVRHTEGGIKTQNSL